MTLFDSGNKKINKHPGFEPIITLAPESNTNPDIVEVAEVRVNQNLIKNLEEEISLLQQNLEKVQSKLTKLRKIHKPKLDLIRYLLKKKGKQVGKTKKQAQKQTIKILNIVQVTFFKF